MKRKKIFKYSFIVMLLSLLLVSCFSSSPSLEEIQLSCNTELTYDINEKIPVTVKTTPDDYEIPESSLKSNGGKLYYDKYSNIIFESTKPGTYKISIEFDDIKSNQVTIKIEDKKAIKKKEEKLRAEAKKKKQQTSNKENKKENLEKIKNQNNETAETKSIDLNKQQHNQENSYNSNQYTQTDNHHDSTPIEGEVWVSATGSKYHSIPDCGNMNPNKASKITLSEAQSRGLEPCKKCH